MQTNFQRAKHAQNPFFGFVFKNLIEFQEKISGRHEHFIYIIRIICAFAYVGWYMENLIFESICKWQ